MYREIAKLIIYRNFEKDSILLELAEICRKFDSGSYDRDALVSEIYMQIHRLLDLATVYGFDGNLWQNYLTWLLITMETPFSLTCEKRGSSDGTVNQFALSDFKIFRKMFDDPFETIEYALGINCFDAVRHYQAVKKPERSYNKNVSEKVRELSKKLACAGTTQEFFDLVTGFYQSYGVGMIGLHKAFRIRHGEQGAKLEAITNTDDVRLSDLVGYEIQKKKLVENTEAFIEGRRANNVLLFGDSGTGKSTSIKAIMNEYYDRGLRVIEIFKHQFQDLSSVIAQIKNRNYRFIIYMDDLSFEEFEIEYKYLKAVIEGGLETRPDNVLIYATSNRRHLIKENWKDRNDMEHQQGMHHSDTMEEKLSLVHRFGVTINYSKPTQKEFFHIVEVLAAKCPEIALTSEELYAEANKWELSHGGISGRTAQQFVDYLAGKKI